MPPQFEATKRRPDASEMVSAGSQPNWYQVGGCALA